MISTSSVAKPGRAAIMINDHGVLPAFIMSLTSKNATARRR